MNAYTTATTLYVNTKTGNDWFPGLTPEPDGFGNGPIATLHQAFSIVGQMRFDGLMQPITVKLMDDVLELSSTVLVQPREDARYRENTPTSMTIEPYGNGRTTIAGGSRITGWKRDTFRGVSCFSAQVPEVKEGKWDFSDLYVDGDRADFTRFPAEGYLVPEDVENHGTVLSDGSQWFVAKEGDLPDSEDMDHAFISFGHYWIDEHSKVESYDKATRKVVLESCTRFTVAPEAGPSARMDYYVENLPEMFRNPNEWYLDHQNGMLYYIPKNDSQTPENITVYAPRVAKLIEILGEKEDMADSIRFRRLNFAYTKGEYASLGYPRSHRDEKSGGSTFHAYTEGKAYASDLQSCSDMHAAIEMTYAKNCSLEECDIFCVGNHGVSIGYGCQYDRVENCHLYCLGAGGVRITGGRNNESPDLATWGNVITDCHIEDGGRRYFAACGVVILHTPNNEVSHCDIHDFYYSGISCGWVWGYHDSPCNHNRLLYNHIYNLGKGRLSDMGGIYILGPQKGTVLRGNVIHDVKCKVYGGWAIYTDEGSSYITVEDNLCYNCSSNCYHQHYGQQNVLRNNIFAFAGESLVINSRREAHTALLLENNIFLSNGSPMYAGAFNTNVISNRNLFWALDGSPMVYQKEGKEVPAADAYKVFAMDKDSTVADPKFADPKNANFTLAADSPAYAMGFRPIDAGKAGVRKA